VTEGKKIGGDIKETTEKKEKKLRGRGGNQLQIGEAPKGATGGRGGRTTTSIWHSRSGSLEEPGEE